MGFFITRSTKKNPMRFILYLTLIFTGLIPPSLHAQILDDTFQHSLGINDRIYEIVPQKDGEYIIYGYIAAYGASSGRIARIDANGAFDQSFNPGTGFNGPIGAVAIQADNKILVGGAFTQYNGTAVRNIARLNPNGSLDNTFNPGGDSANGGAYDFVESILIDPTSQAIYLGGRIGAYNGVKTKSIIRLSSDGFLDVSFVLPETVYGEVYTIARQGSKILIAGAIGIDGKYQVLRLNDDGSLDATFAATNHGVGPVFAMTVQPDNKILVGGDFFMFNESRDYQTLIRLNAEGTIDNTFHHSLVAPHSGVGPYYSLVDIELQPDNKIVVAGYLTAYGTTPLMGIARLNPDGSLDNNFGACDQQNGGISAFVRIENVYIEPGGKIIAAGGFTNFYNNPANLKMLRFNRDIPAPALPAANFDFVTDGDLVSFMNQSSNATTYTWNFGSGNNSTVTHPVKTYSSSGNYDVKLTAAGHCGIKSTATKQVRILGVQEVYPRSGGNNGSITITLRGFGFHSSTSVSLVPTGTNTPSVTGTNTIVSENGKQVSATFDLTGQPIGEWDIMILNQTGFRRQVKAFQVVAGVAPDVHVEIIGRDLLRRNTPQVFTVRVTNQGNNDAYGVPLFVLFKNDTTARIIPQFEFWHPDDDVPYDSIPPYFNIDLVDGLPGQAILFPMILPPIPANGYTEYAFEVSADKDIEIYTWVTPSYYEMATSPSGRTTSELEDNVKKCVTGVLDLTFELLDLNKCAESIASDGLGAYMAAFDANEQHKVASVVFAAARITMNCIGLAPVARLSRAALFFARVASNMNKIHDYYNLNVETSINLAACVELVFHKQNVAIRNIRAVNSFDPNKKVGPTSNPHNTYIKGDAPGSYQIYFENLNTATAPAQTVSIVDTLDATVFDLRSFQLSAFGFGANVEESILPGLREYTKLVDLRPQHALIVKVDAKLDTTKGILTWLFTSLDPETMDTPEDPLAGFLPPNNTAPEGEGYISYSIAPRKHLTTNTQLPNKAFIYFDNNEAIITNLFINQIDKTTPASTMQDLSNTQPSTTFQVAWTGDDNGSGIRSYDVYYAVDEGPFSLWLHDTPLEDATFTGENDHTYSFFSRTHDYAGNSETMKPTAEAATTVTDAITGIEPLVRPEAINVYPNPIHENTVIVFNMITPGHVKVELFDAQGNSKAILADTLFDRGPHKIGLANLPIPKGMYLCRVQVNQVVHTVKVLKL
jgi:uncharacterized delta-60 repeat protein